MIYILVPTYGKVQQTKNFLNSISKSIKDNYLVILIDDHPQKLTLKNFQQNLKLKIITSNKEIWWVGSINLGIKTLLDDYILENYDTVIFANNDIEIEPDSFNLLNKELKKNNLQIIHPRTFEQNNIEVSSGTKIISFFPYITIHPKNFINEKQLIDMGNARFLMMGAEVLKKVRYINKNLIQYGGDNDFTLSAKRFHKIHTYLLRDAICKVDNFQTGIKMNNINDFKELYKSFFSIRSPNNVKFRYQLFKKFFGKLPAFLITIKVLNEDFH